jgi:hypothetical protein
MEGIMKREKLIEFLESLAISHGLYCESEKFGGCVCQAESHNKRIDDFIKVLTPDPLAEHAGEMWELVEKSYPLLVENGYTGEWFTEYRELKVKIEKEEHHE